MISGNNEYIYITPLSRELYTCNDQSSVQWLLDLFAHLTAIVQQERSNVPKKCLNPD